MLNKFRNNDKGFTLVELMMVIVILGVLAGVAVPMVGRMRENAVIAKLGSYADSLGTAIIMDALSRDAFPDNTGVTQLISISGDTEKPKITVGATPDAGDITAGNVLNVVAPSAGNTQFTINGYVKGNNTAVVTRTLDLVEAVK